MQPSPSSWRSALRAAFPHTVPILAGFLVLGATYGMLMQAIGYGPLWSGLFSAIAFGGSTQYAAVPLLAAMAAITRVRRLRAGVERAVVMVRFQGCTGLRCGGRLW